MIPTKYMDREGAVVEVTHGLGDVWIVGRRNPRTGNHHRVKTNAMPPRQTAAECQRDLDEYARRKRWAAVPICADRHAHDDPSNVTPDHSQGGRPRPSWDMVEEIVVRTPLFP